jgi:nucleotide-binding universal stress UspA family protein
MRTEYMMSRRLMCAVDDSAPARAAARLAAGLAARLDADLVLAHAVAVKAPVLARAVPTQLGLDYRRLRRDAARDARRLLVRIARDIGRADCDRRIDFGPAPDCLSRVAAEVHPLLLVVGSRGRHGVQGAILGSVSASMARRAPCPVVVVPPALIERVWSPTPRSGAAGPAGTLVCGVSGLDDRPVATAAWLARALGDRLVLAHVLSSGSPFPGARATTSVAAHVLEQRTGLQRLQRALHRIAVDGHDPDACGLRLRRGDPAEQLARIAQEEDAELTVVGAWHTGGVRDGVGIRLAARGRTPVVVAPARRPGGGSLERMEGSAQGCAVRDERRSRPDRNGKARL